MNASKAAQGSPFYVGTYTEPGKSKGIYACSLNVESGDLTLHSLVAEVPNPTWVTFSPNGKFLYSTQKVQDCAIRAFRVESDGSLTALNSESSKGNAGCHLLVDATGKNILTANYSSGSVDVVRLEEDGSLGKRTAFIKLTGAGPDPIRQTQSYAHGVFEDLENARVYVCDLGSDCIWIYNFDSEKGTLTPNTPPAGQVVPGSGPRHLARHSTGKFFYVNGEMGINITVFECRPTDGGLKSIQVLSTLPEGTSGTGVTSAGVCLHPGERWLYVSNRGHDSITVYAVQKDGRLKWVENVSAQVKGPRGFAIHSSGKWLVVAGQYDDTLTTLQIDPLSGKLSPTGKSLKIYSPVCIAFSSNPE